jgi:hypothetical protein
MGIGQWELQMKTDTPRPIMDRLDPRVSGFGHIVITNTEADVTLGEGLLSFARYTGVLRSQPSEFQIGGPGLGMWIEDEDGKGPSYPGALFTAGGTFAQWVSKLRPASLIAGFTEVITSKTFQTAYEKTTLRKPLDEVCAYFGTEWRVSPSFRFDIGYPASLFRATPKAVVVAKAGDGGRDYNVTGIVGDMTLSRDVEDVVRRVVLFTHYDPDPENNDVDDVNVITPSVSGISDANYPYRDPRGDSLTMDELVDEGEMASGTEQDYVQALFAPKKYARQEISLDGTQYDIGNDVAVGDPLYVFDQARGIYNLDNPVSYRGQTIFPEVIRCVGLRWPIRRGMGVYLRRYVKPSGAWVPEWTDLTNYVDWDTGTTSVEVGAKPRTSRN